MDVLDLVPEGLLQAVLRSKSSRGPSFERWNPSLSVARNECSLGLMQAAILC